MVHLSRVAVYLRGSGRYPPSDERQLQEAAEVFESFDFAVKSWVGMTIQIVQDVTFRIEHEGSGISFLAQRLKVFRRRSGEKLS